MGSSHRSRRRVRPTAPRDCVFHIGRRVWRLRRFEPSAVADVGSGADDCRRVGSFDFRGRRVGTTGIGTAGGARQQSRPSGAPPNILPPAGDPIPPNVLIFSRLRPEGIRQLVALDLSRDQADPVRAQTMPAGSGPSTICRPSRGIGDTSPSRRNSATTSCSPSPRGNGGEKLLTIDENPVAVSNDARATWSPDGKRLAYVANRNGRDDLFVYDTDTRSESRITDDALSEADPSWSPVADEIVYSVAASNESGLDVMRVSLSDRSVVPLTVIADDDSDPSWSPDGTKIAFARRGRGEGAATQLFVMNGDGSDVRALLPPSSAVTVPNDSDPSWSPDGLQIAFESDRDQGLWVADVAQPAEPRSLLDDPDSILVHPAWS